MKTQKQNGRPLGAEVEDISAQLGQLDALLSTTVGPRSLPLAIWMPKHAKVTWRIVRRLPCPAETLRARSPTAARLRHDRLAVVARPRGLTEGRDA